MLIDNIQYLRKNYSHLREWINESEEQLKLVPIEVIDTKTGVPTLQVSTTNGRPLFIHSKYDPIKEAKTLVGKYEKEIAEYDHIFFYGVGFGYHIEVFLNNHQDKTFTMFEPNPAIFYHYMNNRKIELLPTKNLKNLYVQWNQELGSRCIEQFASSIEEKVLLVIHPSYARAFPSELEQFSTQFKDQVQKKGMSHATTQAFAKRWTFNSLMNLPTTLTTPNLLTDKKHYFKDKPVLLVSAGPSLSDEYDNLRTIKENGLAYIFAVGSANRALIANDILPDAVCTYDPQPHNYQVFMPMLENHIDTVPMIYGTSVGYETLECYKGPKLHVITSQDKLTPFFNDKLTISEIVDDAFSIAIVTLQILAKLGAGPVILVGQNFAFRDNLFYSKDIKRGIDSAEVQERDTIKSLEVEDVNGNRIKTNQAFNQMRLAMEQYIDAFHNIEIVNTTKGGAKIKGTTFVPLEELIKNRLKDRIVDKNWYIYENRIPNFDKQKNMFLKEMSDFTFAFKRVQQILEEIDKWIREKNINKIEGCFQEFDKRFSGFINNNFNLIVIKPTNRIKFEKLQNDIHQLNKNQNILQKGKGLIQVISIYLHTTMKTFNEISPFVASRIKEQNNEFKREKSDCGVFSYSFEWIKDAVIISGEQNVSLTFHRANKIGSKIKFRFSGSAIKLLAGKRNDFATKVEVKIDGKSEIISTKDNRSSEFIFSSNEIIYEKNNLTNNLHEVEITLLEDKPFIFNGVEFNPEGRLFHIDEVTKIEKLEIGKRIRCHYKAKFNRVGTFDGLGEEVKEFIPPESSINPDGDFYFIMVDEIEGGKKKLIADRNVQHSISWESLKKREVNTGMIIQSYINNEEIYIRLLKGGQSFEDVNNEWNLYLDFIKKESIFINDQKYCWTATVYDNKAVVRNGSQKHWGLAPLWDGNSNKLFLPVLEIEIG